MRKQTLAQALAGVTVTPSDETHTVKLYAADDASGDVLTQSNLIETFTTGNAVTIYVGASE